MNKNLLIKLVFLDSALGQHLSTEPQDSTSRLYIRYIGYIRYIRMYLRQYLRMYLL